MSEKTLQIFISSPGDVGQERVVAERVVERLRGEFAGRATLQPVRWEREPLRATEHPQEQITPPAETDIAVFILWSRLGTPLPEDKFQKDSGKQYRSGTEWEFENAIEGYREAGTPDLLTYRKTKDPRATLSDKEELQRRLEQKDALESFIDRWFKGEEGTFRAAFHTFETPDEFERRLEEHLRSLIEEKVPARATGREEPEARWHKGSPFRGLRAFEQEHAPVFFGRTKEVGEVIEALKAQAGEGEPFVLVTGPSGSGKSSLVKAGVASTLTEPGVAEGVGYWRQASFRPSDAPGDLIHGLARALVAGGALPSLEEEGWDAGSLADLLRKAPEEAQTPLRQALAREAERYAEKEGLPDPPEARLLLAVDQMEEIFTLDGIDETEREAFGEAVRALTESGLAWTVGTMRSDFYPRLTEVEALRPLRQGRGQYALDPPSFTEVGRIIRKPARAAGLRFEKDPETGEGLDEVLHEAAAGEPEALPLLEFTLEELYQRRKEEVLTYEAYEELGGLEGAIAERAEEVYQETSAEAKAAFSEVMERLVTIRQGEDGGGAEGAAASRRVPIGEIATTDAREALVESFVEARLLVTGRNDAGEAVVSLAHEALLREWPRLREWVDRNRSFLQARARVRERATRWAQEGRPEDLLLPTGQPLAEGRGLLEEREEALSETLRTYIEQSIERAERQRRRRRQIVGGVLGAFVLVVAGFGLFSYQQWTESVERRNQVLKARSLDLAEKSRARTDSGDAMTGMLLALRALPEDVSDPSRPYVPEAQAALYHAWAHNREQAFFDPHEGPITGSSFGPNGRYLATISEDSTARLYDLRTKEIEAVLRAEKEPFSIVAFDSTGSRVVTASGRAARSWKVPSGRPTQTVAFEDSVDGVRIGPGGDNVLTMDFRDADGELTDSSLVSLFSIAEGKLESTRVEGTGLGGLLGFGPEGRKLYAATVSQKAGFPEDPILYLWRDRLRDPVSVPLRGDAPQQIAFTPRGRQLMATSARVPFRGRKPALIIARFRLPDLARMSSVLKETYFSGKIDARTRRVVAYSGTRGDAMVLEGSTGRVISRTNSPSDDASVSAVSFPRYRDRFITGHKDGGVRVWSTTSGQKVKEFSGQVGGIGHVELQSDENRVVTIGKEGVQIWNTANKPRVKTLGESVSDVANGQVRSVAVGPDGDHVVRIDSQGQAHLVDLLKGTGDKQLTKLSASVSDLEFGPKGRKLATGNLEGTVQIWDVASGERRAMLRHSSPVRQVHLAGKGKRVVVTTGSIEEDTTRVELPRTLSIWSIDPKEKILEIDSLDHPRFDVNPVRLFPERSRVLVTLDPVLSSAEKHPRPARRDSVIIQIRSVKDGRLLTQFGKNERLDGVLRSGIGPGGQYLLAKADTTIKVVDPRRGDVAGGIDPDIGDDFGSIPAVFIQAAFRPDGESVGLANLRPTEGPPPEIQVFDLETLTQKYSVRFPGDLSNAGLLSVRNMAFGASGKHLVAVAPAGNGKSFPVVWRLPQNSGKPTVEAVLQSQEDGGSLRYGPDGTHLITYGGKEVRAYGTEAERSDTYLQETMSLQHGSNVDWARFTPGGRYVLTRTEQNQLRLWPLFDSPQTLIDSARAQVTRRLTDVQKERFNLVR